MRQGEPDEVRAAAASRPSVERLAVELLDVERDPHLAGELGTWLAGSARFRAFVDAHRAKIRKKLRGAADSDALLDVRAELRVAHLLLADRRIELAFESYGSGNRGPDFSLRYRGGRPCNLEVTRRRGGSEGAQYEAPLLAKLRQLPPGAPNLLLVAVAGEVARPDDLAATVRAVRARADARDEAFLRTRGFAGTRDFYDRFLRLGALLAWSEVAREGASLATWVNASARIAVPGPILRAVTACLQPG